MRRREADAGASKLIVDRVMRDASSIAVRFAANWDIKALENPDIIQRIVYDDEERWAPSDLNLLRMAATIVLFRPARGLIDTWAA